MDKAVKLFKALMAAYIITGILLLVLAALLFKLELSEGQVRIGIILIYILACAIAGLIIGKMSGSKKYLWGIATGAAYFIILAVISFAVNREIQSEIGDIITTVIICTCSGMFGGMIS